MTEQEMSNVVLKVISKRGKAIFDSVMDVACRLVTTTPAHVAFTSEGHWDCCLSVQLNTDYLWMVLSYGPEFESMKDEKTLHIGKVFPLTSEQFTKEIFDSETLSVLEKTFKSLKQYPQWKEIPQELASIENAEWVWSKLADQA